MDECCPAPACRCIDCERFHHHANTRRLGYGHSRNNGFDDAASVADRVLLLGAGTGFDTWNVLEQPAPKVEVAFSWTDPAGMPAPDSIDDNILGVVGGYTHGPGNTLMESGSFPDSELSRHDIK